MYITGYSTMRLCSICSVIFTVLLGTVNAEKGKLESVIVLFRHGDRTPISFYPNDPYKDRDNWPVGFGQLTNRGKNMQYNLGKFLRNRYNDFLSEKYDENDIYVRASDVDRTMMSAMSNLAGLYPPQGDQIWNPDIHWQPIPVHTVPMEYDKVIGGHPKCPKMEMLEQAVNDDPEILKVVKNNEWVFQYLTNETGMNVTCMKHIDYIFDALFIEKLYNKTLPLWTKKVFPEKMKPMRDLSFAMMTWNHELKRLRGGPLVQAILEHFQGFIKKDKKFKLVMFSGHDTTVATLLNTLGLFDPPLAPPYASMVIVELRSLSNQYFVNFSFRNDTNRPPYQLTLPNCENLCEIEKFAELTKPVRPDEQTWKTECDLHADPTADTVTAVSISISVAMAMLLLMAVMVSCLKRCTSKKEYHYFSIQQN